MKRSEHDRAIGLAMLESCGFLSLPRWPKQKALPPPGGAGRPAPTSKTDGTA